MEVPEKCVPEWLKQQRLKQLKQQLQQLKQQQQLQQQQQQQGAQAYDATTCTHVLASQRKTSLLTTWLICMLLIAVQFYAELGVAGCIGLITDKMFQGTFTGVGTEMI